MNVIDRLHELFEFFWMQICFLVFWFSASRSYQELSRSAYVIRWGTTTPQHRPLHLSLFLWDSVAKMNEFSASIVDDDSHSALHKRGRNQMFRYACHEKWFEINTKSWRSYDKIQPRKWRHVVNEWLLNSAITIASDTRTCFPRWTHQSDTKLQNAFASSK